jgi:hypothetical protein
MTAGKNVIEAEGPEEVKESKAGEDDSALKIRTTKKKEEEEVLSGQYQRRL